MLNFSKINVLIIYLLFLFTAIFSLLNFQDENNRLINKKINLGLDLQGGSYLLLEINSDNLVKEKIQAKVIPIKKLLKDNGINYSNYKSAWYEINSEIYNKAENPIDIKIKTKFYDDDDNLLFSISDRHIYGLQRNKSDNFLIKISSVQKNFENIDYITLTLEIIELE